MEPDNGARAEPQPTILKITEQRSHKILTPGQLMFGHVMLLHY